MAVSFVQTDTDAGLASTYVGCQGGFGTNTAASRLTAIGGTPGTGTVSPAVQGTAGGITAVADRDLTTANELDNYDWNAGTWTWRYNVTVANMNLTLDQVYICRVNSSNVSQAIIGSVTGLAISLGSTGVKSGNITGSAQTPAAGDKVVILYVVTSGAMTSQSYSRTPNQNIDSPFAVKTVTADFIPRRGSFGQDARLRR